MMRKLDNKARMRTAVASREQGRGTLLAQNVEQSELESHHPVGAIPADQSTVPAATAKAVSPYRELQAIAIL
jgi:hypothetical protein